MHERFFRRCSNPYCFSMQCRYGDICGIETIGSERRQSDRQPHVLTKWKDPLPIPPLLKPRHKTNQYTYYEVNMTEFKQRLHSELPVTTVWGYEKQYPGPIIEVESGERVYVKWKNKLPDHHLLPIDHTVHGAHENVPDVRTVVHVHGANVEAESDGYPEAWFTKDFKQVGPYFRKAIYQYDNQMRSCMLWYHDHALGITRLNVYAGLAGLYIIRNDYERSLNLPSGSYEIPLVLQDKTFNPDGSLYYPSQTSPPINALPVSIVPEFFGECNLVNGTVWPYLEVEPRKYRFRILNAANTRFYRIKLDRHQLMYQIGTDGGLMEYPIGITEVVIAPAERVDLIIDFSNMNGQHIHMLNDAPAPFPQGDKPNVDTVGVVMRFSVTLPLKYIDTSVIPHYLQAYPQMSISSENNQRFLTLDMMHDAYNREMTLLDAKTWDDPVSEIMLKGTLEVWYLINLTVDAHPIHIHLEDFQIIDRRPFDVERFKKEKQLIYTGPARALEPQERGWKDTVRANPQEVTRIIKKFDSYTGLYVWHCHMLEHEDYEMMRPFLIIHP